VSLILVIGGYGGFGARLCRRLSEAGHSLLVGGRSADKAALFCANIDRARPLSLDRDGDLGPILAAERPDLVIDASGPFQGSDYRVPKACIRAGISYLDLADARDFVTGIGALNGAARAAGVAVIAGASTAPALTGAVLRRLAEGLDRVDKVDISLSAANRASGAGATLAAALSYAGRPLRLWRGGRWTRVSGWQEMRRESFLFADGSGLRGRRVALADLPDCELLPDLVPGRPAVAFRAGTELGFQMWALWLASFAVRWGWLTSLRGALPWLMPVYRLTGRLGGKRSAMKIVLTGRREGRAVERRWTIVAEQGEGLEIPTLAAELLAADLLAGRLSAGARHPAASLTLDRFESAFARLPVRTEIVEHILPPPLYARAMGEAFTALPPVVRQMHDVRGDAGAEGEGRVVRGHGLVARAIGEAMRFPREGLWPLHVGFAERDGVERWTRDFGGQAFSSELSAEGSGVAERFGPLRFVFDLTSDASGLEMRLTRWTALGIPMPRLLAPRILAREWEANGQFHFAVAVALPLAGEIVGYSGWLEPIPLSARGQGADRIGSSGMEGLEAA
jgi:NAD(P)-dependent dehydrogenase (short-subunit alcohol dehydrogenase family)